jgi:hypothetical protein
MEPSGQMRKLVGSIDTSQSFVALESPSKSTGKRRPRSWTMSRAVRGLPPICTARTAKRLEASEARNRSREGSSSRQGSHQVAQKFRRTTLPR